MKQSPDNIRGLRSQAANIVHNFHSRQDVNDKFNDDATNNLCEEVKGMNLREVGDSNGKKNRTN